MADLRDLQPLAQRLNAATDELNAILQTIQDRLNELALGVEAWLDAKFSQELSRHAGDPRTELDGRPVASWSHDVDELVTVHRTVQVQKLGYGRLGDSWGFLVRTVMYREVKTPDGWETETGDEGTEDERKPLLRAARQVRVKAIDLIPALIDKLRDEASRVIDAVEKAKHIAQSLK